MSTSYNPIYTYKYISIRSYVVIYTNIYVCKYEIKTICRGVTCVCVHSY